MNFKKLGKAILFPPTWLIILLVPIAAFLLIYGFAVLGGEHTVSYISYALSAYALTVVCFRIPRMIAFYNRFKNENKYVLLFRTDTRLRVKLSLYFSLILNTSYAFLQLGMGLWHRSVWFLSLAVYYILLVIMRYFLLRDVRGEQKESNPVKEFLRYRFCGIILVLMNVALSGIVLYITRFNYGFKHHYITTIALATFTFTSFTLAVVNIVKYKKLKNPVYSASKIISLASASVSLLTLETAMLTAFGEADGEEFRRIVTTATGTVVCVFVLFMAVNMIIYSTRELKTLRSSSNNE